MKNLHLQPVMTEKELRAQCSEFLKPENFVSITESTQIFCEGKLVALFLKAEEQCPINQLSYDSALHGLKLMSFTPASHSRRAAIKQALGGDLLLGWMDGYAPDREDIFRGGHRDHFIAAFWLTPLLKDFEQAIQNHLPDYWEFHRSVAQRLVRPKRERLKTLGNVSNIYERKMLRDWDKDNRLYLMPGSDAFSTVTLNQNIRFLPHKDGKNVPDTLSCLTTLGSFSGGALGFPRLGVSFDIQPGDLLISDTNDEYHGTFGEIFGNRYSVVAYLHESLLKK